MQKEAIQKFDFRLNTRKPFDVLVSRHPGVTKTPSRLDMHRALHLGLLRRGRLRSSIRGRSCDLAAPAIYLIAPWEPHGTLICEELDILLLSIAEEELLRPLLDGGNRLRQLIRLEPGARMAYLNTPRLQPMAEDFRNELEALLAADPPQPARIWHRIVGFFLELDEKLELPAVAPQGHRLDRALELLHRRAGQAVPLAEAAAACGLGTSRFRHLFKAEFGLSFGTYELQYRLGGAAEALAGSPLPLKEIAAAWGFFDPAHFSRAFRKYYRQSPGEYRTGLGCKEA